ncbi:MAG: DUF2937 family protein [Bacteroidota bacterium]
MQTILKPLGNVADRIICVVMAVLLAQLPVYINQYVDVLSGAKQESEITYKELVSIASSYNRSVDEYLEELMANPDRMVRDNAEVSQSTVQRYKKYAQALEALSTGPSWMRPFKLARHYDANIHSAIQFEPNIPLTFDGLLYGFVGLLLGMALVGIFRSIWRSLTGNKKTEESIVT